MSNTTIETMVVQTETLFTCLSCSIAFHSAEDQREHYRSDHHRYNMKRRVAGLPPVSVAIFNQKVIERRQETAIVASPKGMTCEVCKKSFTSDNTYKSHLASKKHKDNELKALHTPPASKTEPSQTETQKQAEAEQPAGLMEVDAPAQTPSAPAAVSLNVDDEADEEQINQTIDEKIAAARARLSPTACLFCSTSSSSLDENLTHMSVAHSFFIPDAEYLVDIQGLITYLGEKIAVGNVCIYCNGRGREFRTMEAVRKHMVDKGHCKIAYDAEADRLEISDFYDFTSSYPAAEKKKSKKKQAAVQNEEWEDMDEDEADAEVDEVVEESTSEGSDEEDEDEDEDDLDVNQVTYGDTPYELVLASGARIGHRSMRRYYAQSFPRAYPGARKDEDPNSGAAIVRRLIADKNSALVPARGGFGAYGAGTQVMKARNAGEAREAGRHVREFRDQSRREAFKTKVGFRNNNQKHFRDPLLQ